MKYIIIFLILINIPLFGAKYRRPFNNNIGVNYGFDNDGGASGCKDFTCGSVCYDGHGGTDFPLPRGTDIVSAANGTITATYNNCPDDGYYCSSCGGNCGNYVKIDHGGGYVTLHCHMKLNSIVVSNGQSVSCGQKIGQSASSGCSTGNHLHFGTKVNNVNEDPFAGTCGGPTSYWVNQGSYPRNIPSSECETNCACSPGQTQSQGCGLCGTQTRTCGSNCQWGGWSGCNNQGVCPPGENQNQGCGNCGTQSRSCNGSCQWNGWGGCTGEGCSPGTTQNSECGKCGNQVRNCNSSCQWVNVGDCVNQKECFKGETQDQACCDCGSQRRTCSNTCYWQGWSACAGADPNGGNTDCLTNEFGPCSAGKVKCTNGCLNCKRIYEPLAELCDDVDNDCNGEIDNGEPENFIEGITPQYAAEFKDGGYPKTLKANESGQVWVIFKNKGLKTWYSNGVWIQATNDDSELYNKEKWEAYNIPAVLQYDVLPGEDAVFVFDIKMNSTNKVEEKFQLAFNNGELIKCPIPSIDLTVSITEFDKENDDSQTTESDKKSTTSDSTGCSFGKGNSVFHLMMFFMITFLFFIRKDK